MKYAIEMIQTNADLRVASICFKTDNKILELSEATQKPSCKKNGIAFPTSISLNNVLCHYSPASMDDNLEIKAGDLVKIELGAHVDGYPVLAAHTIIQGIEKEKRISPSSSSIATEKNDIITQKSKIDKMNLIYAAHETAQLATKLIKPNVSNTEIRQPLWDVAAKYGVEWVEGAMSHTLSHNCLSDSKTIIFRPLPNQVKNEKSWTFQPFDVFAIDVALISNKTGRARPSTSTRPTIYIRADRNHDLKLKASRAILGEIDRKFPKMPFNLRQFIGSESSGSKSESSTTTFSSSSLSSLSRIRMAIQECEKHELLSSYEIMEGIEGKELTARFMFTIIVTPDGNVLRLTDDYGIEGIEPSPSSDKQI